MQRKIAVALLLITLILCSGCTPARHEQAAPVYAVSTIFPVGDILANLGGDDIAVLTLLPPGASPHTYEPPADQVRAISSADLFVYVGAGLDNWALKLASAAQSPPLIIELSSSLELKDSNYHRESPDPHFWLDPILVRDMICPLLAEKLICLFPEKEGEFLSNLNSYQDKLTRLDQEIRTVTDTFSQRKFISMHSAWKYFARRYNLQEIEAVTASPGQEPSAGWITDVIEIMVENEVGTILAEPQFPINLAERIAEETGGQVLVIDPLGGEGLPGRETYLELMRFNLDIFKQALN